MDPLTAAPASRHGVILLGRHQLARQIELAGSPAPELAGRGPRQGARLEHLDHVDLETGRRAHGPAAGVDESGSRPTVGTAVGLDEQQQDLAVGARRAARRRPPSNPVRTPSTSSTAASTSVGEWLRPRRISTSFLRPVR